MMRLIPLLLVSIQYAYAFSFLGNIKMPEIHSIQKIMKGKRFGDKKVYDLPISLTIYTIAFV